MYVHMGYQGSKCALGECVVIGHLSVQLQDI